MAKLESIGQKTGLGKRTTNSGFLSCLMEWSSTPHGMERIRLGVPFADFAYTPLEVLTGEVSLETAREIKSLWALYAGLQEDPERRGYIKIGNHWLDRSLVGTDGIIIPRVIGEDTGEHEYTFFNDRARIRMTKELFGESLMSQPEFAERFNNSDPIFQTDSSGHTHELILTEEGYLLTAKSKIIGDSTYVVPEVVGRTKSPFFHNEDEIRIATNKFLGPTAEDVQYFQDLSEKLKSYKIEWEDDGKGVKFPKILGRIGTDGSVVTLSTDEIARIWTNLVFPNDEKLSKFGAVLCYYLWYRGGVYNLANSNQS